MTTELGATGQTFQMCLPSIPCDRTGDGTDLAKNRCTMILATTTICLWSDAFIGWRPITARKTSHIQKL
jgi:hypothetical protein